MACQFSDGLFLMFLMAGGFVVVAAAVSAVLATSACLVERVGFFLGVVLLLFCSCHRTRSFSVVCIVGRYS